MRFVSRNGVYVFEDPNGEPERGAQETSLWARGNQPLNVNNQPYFEPYQKTTGYSGVETSMPTVRKNKEGFTCKQVEGL